MVHWVDLSFHLTGSQSAVIGFGLAIIATLAIRFHMHDIKLPARPHEKAVAEIMEWFRQAEQALVGKEITTFRGARGKVSDIRLDNDHGVMFTFEPPELGERRYFPVSTIRHI